MWRLLPRLVPRFKSVFLFPVQDSQEEILRFMFCSIFPKRRNFDLSHFLDWDFSWWGIQC
jgi:hypothetical protein